MVSNKSLDESKIIISLLNDLHKSFGSVFNSRALKLTTAKVEARVLREGLGFLTKTLPRLCKCLDRALTLKHPMTQSAHGWDTMPGSELPRFLGEFFSRVFDPSGNVLSNPDAKSVAVIRQVCTVFYKYGLPYSYEQEQNVISQFEKTEDDLRISSESQRAQRAALFEFRASHWRLRKLSQYSKTRITHRARLLLSRVFGSFEHRDIVPRHGPGSVATKQRLWGKYQWRNVSSRLTSEFPLDEYFYVGLGHVCDSLDSVNHMADEDLGALVILVPKDSRGPRLISEEPVDNQWIQQGLHRALVDLVERHPLTKWNVRFTDQEPNRKAALYASSCGRYATLDLKEASDRVSLGLVRLLFPDNLTRVLEACRSSYTVLPGGRRLDLEKFAPMGSSLCFPIMALTIWAILTAGASDADTRESIYVYGDDVIVPTAYADEAIELLESYGLKINQDKSCTKGSFRESCGMDAFQGVDVTPVRIRTVWSSHRSAAVYSSYIAYANSFYDKQYFRTYDTIVEALHAVYGAIPDDRTMSECSCPRLREVARDKLPTLKRISKRYQRKLYFVWDVVTPPVYHSMDGWSMLLRFLVETYQPPRQVTEGFQEEGQLSREAALRLPLRFNPSLRESDHEPFGVRSYTLRDSSVLEKRWR